MTTQALEAGTLVEWVRDARRRTLDLVADLDQAQLMGPRLAIVNPLLWEIGHVAWFHEKWVLRHAAGLPPLRADADALYDSAAIAHDLRWNLPLPERAETLAYMASVEERICERLEQAEPSDYDRYFVMLALLHEDMHTEAFTYTRQTLGYPPPRFSVEPAGASARAAAEPCPGDVAVAGGTLWLGCTLGEPFVFDNEKWAHPVEVAPFAIARAAVTQNEYLTFVAERGYTRPELWSDEGWRWREEEQATAPLYWRTDGSGSWQRRDFDRWVPLEPHRPVLHVNWFEAEAYCRWARRRLPSEAEWEMAAVAEREPGNSSLACGKRRFPWGQEAASVERANLDGATLGCCDVGDYPQGDSPCGCRQMIGNVWEWTSSTFLPYPGFVRDPYKEYSEPWFGTHRVLRGGCWATRSRLIRPTYRNFYKPDRRDVWAGFRTCAQAP